MHQNNMYKEMVVYIEACESGSMFENILPDNINIYALSAANSTESSWGTYCGSAAKVNGVGVGSCLGDLFSVNWMEDADRANMATETLQDQYETVAKETTKSSVLQWGQLTFTNEPIGDFEAGDVESSKPEHLFGKLKKFGKNLMRSTTDDLSESVKVKNESAVDSRDNTLFMLYNAYMEDQSVENAQAV